MGGREGKIKKDEEEEDEDEEEEAVEAEELHSLGLIDLYPLKAFPECLSAFLLFTIITIYLWKQSLSVNGFPVETPRSVPLVSVPRVNLAVNERSLCKSERIQPSTSIAITAKSRNNFHESQTEAKTAIHPFE